MATNADFLDDVLGVRLTEVKSLAQALSHPGAPLAQPPAMLREFVDEHPWYWLLAVADASGQITTASGNTRGNIQDRDYFRQALGEEAVISDVFVSPLTHKADMIVASPLREGENQIVGVLAAALRLDKLNSRLLNPGIGQTGEPLLANAAGQLVASARFGQQALT